MLRILTKLLLCFAKYDEVNKEVLALKIDIEKEEKSIGKLNNEINIRERRIRESSIISDLEVLNYLK